MNARIVSRRPWRAASIPGVLLALLAVLISLALAAPAMADPPGRIGRIAALEGAPVIMLSNATSGESFLAPLNQPLSSGDLLRTDANQRAEIQIGSLTLRLDGNSAIELRRVDDAQISLDLRYGRSIVKLPESETLPEFELTTPDARLTPLATGLFRFDVDAEGASATAYFGALRWESANGALNIGAGQRAEFRNSGQGRIVLSNAYGDAFSQWSAARDQQQARVGNPAYQRYVSPEMTGAADLDTWGDWSQTPDYGAVWYPRALPANWVPYRDGHWAWILPWGWTWVGDEPWGFAPFHYGRWLLYFGRWAWVPGPRVTRPLFAPALVAWSPTSGIPANRGQVPTTGWFPLAPHAVFVPAYHASANYIQQVNVTHLDNAALIAHAPQLAMQPIPYTRRDPPLADSYTPAGNAARLISTRPDLPHQTSAAPPPSAWTNVAPPARTAEVDRPPSPPSPVETRFADRPQASVTRTAGQPWKPPTDRASRPAAEGLAMRQAVPGMPPQAARPAAPAPTPASRGDETQRRRRYPNERDTR